MVPRLVLPSVFRHYATADNNFRRVYSTALVRAFNQFGYDSFKRACYIATLLEQLTVYTISPNFISLYSYMCMNNTITIYIVYAVHVFFKKFNH